KSMKRADNKMIHSIRRALGLTLLCLVCTGSANARDNNEAVFAPQSHPRGKSYAEWTAVSTKMFMELPLEGHPALNTDPLFDARYGQSGNVWFLSAPFGTLERWSTIPASISLFLPLLNTECSSVETPDSGFHAETGAAQRDCAKYWSDHIVNPFFVIDGVAVE